MSQPTAVHAHMRLAPLDLLDQTVRDGLRTSGVFDVGTRATHSLPSPSSSASHKTTSVIKSKFPWKASPSPSTPSAAKGVAGKKLGVTAAAAAAAATTATTETTEDGTPSMTKPGMNFVNFELEAEIAGADVGAGMEQARQPCHFVCMIDTSGSMGSLVSTGGEESEKTAFTSLDLAKHSLTVLIHMLRPCDSLALVSFNTTARTVCSEDHVDEGARDRLLAAVRDLDADGSTNIWQALTLALQVARRKAPAHTTLLLLTDGQPNVGEPSKGSAAAFAEHYSKMDTKTVSLHTLGYGYGVASPLLMDLAQVNSGLYAFIPDASIVGTVFVNLMSAVMATTYHHVYASIHTKRSEEGVAGSATAAGAPPIYTRDLGALQLGQKRNFSFLAPAGWQGSVHFSAVDPSSGKTVELSRVTVSVPDRDAQSMALESFDGGDVEDHHNVDLSGALVVMARQCVQGALAQGCARQRGSASDFSTNLNRASKIVKLILRAADSTPTAPTVVDAGSLEAAIADAAAAMAFAGATTTEVDADAISIASTADSVSSLASSLGGAAAAAAATRAGGPKEELLALISDLEGEGADVGQLGHAVEKADWYAKWGQHYLPSVLSAHQLEMCMNFKDASLQFFQGALFVHLQSQAEKLFCTLPPPVASGFVEGAHHGGGGGVGVGSMSSFYDVRGGCFHGSNMVTVAVPAPAPAPASAAGTHAVVNKEMRAVQRGDMLLCGDGQFHRVDCMVVTPVTTPTTTYYNMGKTNPEAAAAPVLLTCYHPVFWNGRWAFPIDVGQRVELPTEAHYNLLLEEGATDIVVEGVRCITLAHGIVDSTVAHHEFLGTRRVRDNLMAMRGYASASGRVVLDADKAERDPKTLRLCKWVEKL